LLTGDLSSGELGQELARPVEVGHLQMGRADAVRIVRVGVGTGSARSTSTSNRSVDSTVIRS